MVIVTKVWQSWSCSEAKSSMEEHFVPSLLFGRRWLSSISRIPQSTKKYLAISTSNYIEIPQVHRSTSQYLQVPPKVHTKEYFGRWLPSTSRYSELYRWLHQDDQTIHSWLHSSRPSSMETGSALRFYPKVIFMLGYKGPSVDRCQKESTLGLNFYRSQSLWSKSYSCSIKIVNMLALLEPPNHN